MSDLPQPMFPTKAVLTIVGGTMMVTAGLPLAAEALLNQHDVTGFVGQGFFVVLGLVALVYTWITQRR